MVSPKTSWLVLVHFIFVSSFSAAASPGYYTVHESAAQEFTQEDILDPMETLTELAATAARKVAAQLDLMQWDHHAEALPDPTVPYNRKAQYGSWVRDPRDSSCFNTRAKVLIRSSSVPVGFQGNNNCNVKSGLWLDPYSNRQYTDSGDIQIDHVVPLKNSYINGGWKWDAKKRCLYANFMANEYHLMAVNGPDNMRKGDRSPEGFMPPYRAYACDYLAIWLKIKLIWNLTLTTSEAGAISQLAKQNQCDPAKLSMEMQELSQQRRSIVDRMDLCASRN